MTIGTIAYWCASDLPGLEVMTVDRSDRIWRAVHAQYAFCAVLAGGGRWRYRGEIHDSGPGSVRLLEPGEVHCDLQLRGPTSCVVLFAWPALVDELVRELGLPRGPCAAATEDPACFAALARWAAPPTEHAVAGPLRGALATVLRRTAGERAPRREPAGRAAVRRARALLHDRFDEQLGLDEVAALSGLTKPHLVRTFHAEVGLPPIEYLMHVRVARAREGLRAGRSPADAALACGFCDQSHLTRWFKKVVGVTPGQYARATTSKPGRSAGRTMGV